MLKPLSNTPWKYVNHQESKLEGNRGVLERKHIKIDETIHIGKETDNIENTGVLNSPE